MKVLTANTLRPGEVVYWSESRRWVPELQNAKVLEDSELEAALKAAANSVQSCEVVAPYAFPVRIDGGQVIPASARENIRARGPSVRTDLGKQAA